MNSINNEPLIPKHGGYRKLKSFQVAQLVYDVTVRFCDRYIDKRSRTHDQMVQAARSGVQNIAEGSMASATSKKMELKLTGVASTRPVSSCGGSCSGSKTACARRSCCSTRRCRPRQSRTHSAAWLVLTARRWRRAIAPFTACSWMG